MTKYRLYVESGPRMKTTMVHVFDLLGCVANGKTTEDALGATDHEIREFLRFLVRHGEDADPDAPFTTSVAQHVMEGSWIGYGDPAPGFEPDFEKFTRKQLNTGLQRLRWLGEDVAALAQRLTPRQLAIKPPSGRPLGEILRHIAGPEPEYARTGGVGKSARAKEISRAIDEGTGDLAGNIGQLFEAIADLFATATYDDLTRVTQRGEKACTLKRGLRRALEHPWEHLREIERRIETKP